MNDVDSLSTSNRKSPKVSVCVVTYNQENYISQCLQSLLEQTTDFDFEIIVADDCSTDLTVQILKDFKLKYPEIIKLHLHTTNIGPYENFHYVHQQANGEYICHVDGDDYCLPGKLQVQSDLLDAEPNCNIVWHRMAIIGKDGVIKYGNSNASLDIKFRKEDVIRLISIGSNSSKMYRRLVREYDVPKFEIVDYFANVEQIRDGYAKLITDKCYGVYRAGIGISSSGNKTRKILAECFNYFSKKYPEHKKEVSLAALTYFLADLKNRRVGCIYFFKIWMMNFSLSSIVRFKSNLKFSRMLAGK